MTKITFTDGHTQVASLDLGEPTGVPGEVGYFEDGDLGCFAGNLYLFADGVEIGSLFFHTEDGKLRVELGQFDPDQQEWVGRNPLGPMHGLPGGEQLLAGLAPVGE